MKRTVLYILGVVVVAVFALAFVGFLSASTACAHDPRFACSPRSAAHPIIVRYPQKSWAFYGHLSPGEDDHYMIVAEKPLHVPWSLLVDVRDSGNVARPEVVVQDPAGRERARLDSRRTVRFYEPFSRESYLSSDEALLVLPRGSYAAIVRMRGGNSVQRYTFAIGEAELFNVTEIPYVLGAVTRIRALHY